MGEKSRKMKNITIALDPDLIQQSRLYARKQGISLNRLIRQFLQNLTSGDKENFLDQAFELMDKAGGNSKGQKWEREDLYDR